MHLAHEQNAANKGSLVQVCSYSDAATEPQQHDAEEALKSRGEGLWAGRQEATWVLDELELLYTPLLNITVLNTNSNTPLLIPYKGQIGYKNETILEYLKICA